MSNLAPVNQDLITTFDERGRKLTWDKETGEQISIEETKYESPIFLKSIGDSLCSLVSLGNPLTEAAKTLNIPLYVIQGWRTNIPEFNNALTNAREARKLIDNERLYQNDIHPITTQKTHDIPKEELREHEQRLRIITQKQQIITNQKTRTSEEDAPTTSVNLTFNCNIPQKEITRVQTKYTPSVDEKGKILLPEEKKDGV